MHRGPFFCLRFSTDWPLLPETETQKHVAVGPAVLGCEVGGVLCVPGRRDCGERSGACGQGVGTFSGRPSLSMSVCQARPCAPWLLGPPLVSAWEAFLWSPDLPMGDARLGVESSTETPE